MFMPYMTGGYYGWGLLGMLLNMVIWGVFIVGIVYLILRIVRGAGGYEPRNNALDILKKRYAAGEISEEDYDRMKDKVK
jgi:putative membrane protein